MMPSPRVAYRTGHLVSQSFFPPARLHVFGESITVANGLEQSATPGASRCSQAFMSALALEPAVLPVSVREAAPLAAGPTAGQKTWDLHSKEYSFSPAGEDA